MSVENACAFRGIDCHLPLGTVRPAASDVVQLWQDKRMGEGLGFFAGRGGEGWE